MASYEKQPNAEERDGIVHDVIVPAVSSGVAGAAGIGGQFCRVNLLKPKGDDKRSHDARDAFAEAA
jgi:hypothetical protein